MIARTISILGATGSIGTSTLDLIERDPDRFEVVALTAGRDVQKLAAAARRTGARFAAVSEPGCFDALREALAGTSTRCGAGPDAIAEAASLGADWTMAAIVGAAGLAPVMAAIAGGRTIALANKEALVCAGALVTAAVKQHGATLLPVDSEHNAVFQCYDHADPARISRIILTASGGPFRTWTLDEMRGVSPERAVRHPNWSMGAKISIDSATLMNKGLELIEAHHLFPIGADKLAVVVHPQSVIHSMVEYVDGSVLAQLGTPDMRTPIAHTLAWPERMATPCERLDLTRVGRLDFEQPDLARFPALALATEALWAGGSHPAVLNAANEEAVAAFLGKRLAFLDIASTVARTLERYSPPAPASIADVLAIDSEAREVARGAMERMAA